MPLTKVQIGMTDAPTSGTAVTASGTSVNFTGIPSTAKRITVMFSGVSTSGTSLLQVQIGDAGGIETTGYSASGGFIQQAAAYAGVANVTSGFVCGTGNNAAANLISGAVEIFNISGNAWCATGMLTFQSSTPVIVYVAGSKTLSDTLTQVRITTVNGTDTFDAGTINIMWE
jgi:hypothetical protein